MMKLYIILVVGDFVLNLAARGWSTAIFWAAIQSSTFIIGQAFGEAAWRIWGNK